MKLITLSLSFLLSFSCFSQEKYNYVLIDKNDTKEQIIFKAGNIVPTERQFQWQQNEMIAFFHFGINTFTDKEWGDGTEDPKIFNPLKFNAEQWIKVIKASGFKQVILTAKHHDGFCLWPTKSTEHSVKNSLWKNGKGDMVKEVSDACKKNDIGFGIYLSPWDRNAKCYGSQQYNDFFTDQLTELLSNYGQIDEVWFDGACGEGPNGKKQVYDFNRWYKLIRELQPQAVIAVMGPDVRWVGTETGLGRNTEWSVIPANNLDVAEIADNSQQNIIGKPLKNLTDQDLGSREKIYKASGLIWYPAETDVSIRPGWFYHSSEDNSVKTPQEILDIYFTSVGMNSLLLLNIPPDTEGLISKNDIRSLKGFKTLTDKIFDKNLLVGSKINGKINSDEMSILDNNYLTYLNVNSKDTVYINLPAKKSFNILCLQENITVGQRVEKFVFQYADMNQNWLTITSGTTIGYKRLLRFRDIKAKDLRLIILSSRLNPALSEIGLYKE